MFVTILYLRKGFGRSFFSFLFFQIPSNSNLNNLKGILLPRNSDSKFELRDILCVDSEDRSQGDGFRQHDIKSIASFENHSDVNGFFIESRGSSVSCYKSVLYMAAPSMSLSEVSSLQALTERVEKPQYPVLSGWSPPPIFILHVPLEREQVSEPKLPKSELESQGNGLQKVILSFLFFCSSLTDEKNSDTATCPKSHSQNVKNST